MYRTSFLLVFLSVFLLVGVHSQATYGTNYYVSNKGNDDGDGLSKRSAWKTIEKINSFKFNPGDSIKFERGSTWREYLNPISGEVNNPITYTAYGKGANPLFLGSLSKNNIGDWEEVTPDIWRLKVVEGIKSDFNNKEWKCWTEGGARLNLNKINEDKNIGYNLEILDTGTKSNHIQFITTNLSVLKGNTYKFQFKIKDKLLKTIPSVKLMTNTSPWDSVAIDKVKASEISSNECLYEAAFNATKDCDKARITIYLGDLLSKGDNFTIIPLFFQQMETQLPALDVGNIIFDGGKKVGIKLWKKELLHRELEFYYDRNNYNVYLFSKNNPANDYSSIELAIRKNIITINSKSNVIFENLDIKYGAAHGIAGASSKNVIVRNCNIDYIGGGDQYGNGKNVRYGNGIEFWDNAENNIVEDCVISNIYDAGVTNQGTGAVLQKNIIYRNNKIVNCEYSFEYWNHNENSVTEDILFENNYCTGVGNSWGHTQRSDPSGRQICFYNLNGNIKNIKIQNNVFENFKGVPFYFSRSSDRLKDIRMDSNTVR